ncbi:ThuA domain-containing protein [Micromonospora sp. M12]
MAQQRALVVRGGWEGISRSRRPSCSSLPRTQRLCRTGRGSAEIYADAAEMAATDLVVQCMTMSQITSDQAAGLSAAVVAGTGFTGWHGGIVDSFRASSEYLHLVGGQFATHPGKEPCERHGGPEDNFLRTRCTSPTSAGSIRSPRASRTSTWSPSSTGCCTTT